ncbi:uncharacterized protein LOC115677340 [Syzygium oleosum]|uniref:uncharacterized protein LOC115677340 n=1 Tax=Syzygium oleosum TaxID=219896 RepID=UPI0024BAED42|nr:uncharacterized protein LOC115677340 [Syzygium oleosum]
MRRLLLACLFFVNCSKVLSSESEGTLRPAHNHYKPREEESSAALDLISKIEEKYHERKAKERDYQNNQGEVQKVHNLNSVNKGKGVYGGGDLIKPRKKTHSGAPANVLHASFLSAAVGPVVVGLVAVTLLFQV